MKIGILTYHRSYNFGALLQALALRQKLADMGNEVYIIDYWPYYHYDMYALFPLREIGWMLKKGQIKSFVHMFIYFPKRYRKMINIRKFLNQYSRPFWVKYSKRESFDIVVYGSDQIWRKQSRLHNTFNRVYFGENILRSRKKVSYAASMGLIDLNHEEKGYLRSALLKFDKISVRETSLNDLLINLGLKSEIVLDPTLLFDRDDWERMIEVRRTIEGKYVLFYEILPNSIDEEQVKNYAHEHGLKYIKLLTSARCKHQEGYVIDTEGPDSLISLVKYAEIVFTSSFHGLVFSILYNKPFYSSYAKNAGRAESLIEALRLNNCLLEPMSKIPDAPPGIDYAATNERLRRLRQSSIAFLRSI